MGSRPRSFGKRHQNYRCLRPIRDRLLRYRGGTMSRKTTWSEAYWREFVLHSGVDANDYAICSFGDSPAMASELADLVLVGTKRATASLARDYADGHEPLPKVGDY